MALLEGFNHGKTAQEQVANVANVLHLSEPPDASRSATKQTNVPSPANVIPHNDTNLCGLQILQHEPRCCNAKNRQGRLEESDN